MRESGQHRDHESRMYGHAHAVRLPGDTHWRVSFGGAFKGTADEVDGAFHAVYRAHGVGTDLGDHPSLSDAIEALMDED